MTWTTETLLALAARMKIWALAMLAWLADAVGGAFRARVRDDVRRAEDGVAATLVLLALKRLPPPPPLSRKACRPPLGAPRGFAWRAVNSNDMPNLRRFLMPRTRSLAARVRQLLALLDAIEDHLPKLARRIACVPPAFALVSVAPPADAVMPKACVAAAGADTS